MGASIPAGIQSGLQAGEQFNQGRIAALQRGAQIQLQRKQLEQRAADGDPQAPEELRVLIAEEFGVPVEAVPKKTTEALGLQQNLGVARRFKEGVTERTKRETGRTKLRVEERLLRKAQFDTKEVRLQELLSDRKVRTRLGSAKLSKSIIDSKRNAAKAVFELTQTPNLADPRWRTAFRRKWRELTGRQPPVVITQDEIDALERAAIDTLGELGDELENLQIPRAAATPGRTGADTTTTVDLGDLDADILEILGPE